MPEVNQTPGVSTFTINWAVLLQAIMALIAAFTGGTSPPPSPPASF
jgi:hypothetical protein